jgi:hypothetical protein
VEILGILPKKIIGVIDLEPVQNRPLIRIQPGFLPEMIHTVHDGFPGK